MHETLSADVKMNRKNEVPASQQEKGWAGNHHSPGECQGRAPPRVGSEEQRRQESLVSGLATELQQTKC